MFLKILLILCCVFSLSSCGKTTEEAEKPPILTNVFRGTAIELPEEYTLTANVLPYRNLSSDEITVLCQTDEHLALVTVFPDGSVNEPTVLEIDPQTVSRAVITEEILYYLEFHFDNLTAERSYTLHTVNLSDGTAAVSGELSEYFTDNASLRIGGMAVTADGLVCIGYPTAEGKNGSTVDMMPYVITSFCEMPELAWDFLEIILLPDNFQTFGARLPALRSQVKQICTDAYQLYWDVNPTGGIGGSTLAYADEVDPGNIRYLFTEQHEREFLDFLDNIAGQPILTLSDDVITEILTEEFTSFFGGAKTAEECADIIQSRVSIYLSENE